MNDRQHNDKKNRQKVKLENIHKTKDGTSVKSLNHSKDLKKKYSMQDSFIFSYE